MTAKNLPKSLLMHLRKLRFRLLTPRELRGLGHALVVDHLTLSAIVQGIIERLDKDSDGKISKAEGQEDSNLAPRFDDGDLNKDGFIRQGGVD